MQSNSTQPLQPSPNCSSLLIHVKEIGSWMGRTISSYFPFYHSNNKTQEVALPKISILEKSPRSYFFEEEDCEPLFSIVETLFEQMNLSITPEDALSHAVIFNPSHEEQENIDLHLNGEYQIEWKILEDKTFSSSVSFFLIYRGTFLNGLFHGPGEFVKQDLYGSLYPLLKGNFDHGVFVSGRIILEDSYIEGNFINGKMQGEGTIHYFEEVLDEEGNRARREYRGEFYKAKPHGDGSLFLIESDRVKEIGKGKFKEGFPLKGCFQENNKIFKGTWEGEIFNGTVKNFKEGWSYVGRCMNQKFEGEGKLTVKENHEYEDLEFENEEEDISTKVKKNDSVTSISKGIFRQGKFYKGTQKINWDHGRKEKRHFKKGINIKSEIMIPEGLTYAGNFAPYTINGKGNINNEEGEEIYTGRIKKGSPHGKGCRKYEGITEEGHFDQGTFLDDEASQ